MSSERLIGTGLEIATQRNHAIAALPAPDVYERESTYLPWIKLLHLAVEWAAEISPCDSIVADYMCGTGLFLRLLHARRPDLRLIGCDANADYLSYAASQCSALQLERCDVFEFEPAASPSIAVCTAGLHHVPHQEQRTLLCKIADQLSRPGWMLLGEIVLGAEIPDSVRRLSALELGRATLQHAICHNAPADVLDALVQVMRADLLDFEFKRSREALLNIVGEHFFVTREQRTWPDDNTTGFGENLLLCQPLRDFQKLFTKDPSGK